MRFLILVFCTCLVACSYTPKTLPIIGERDVVNGDTVYHSVRPFSFTDQDSQLITENTFKDKIYVVDFFFTHCPTICPKVTKQMLRVYEKYKDNDRVLLLSHSIDTRNDTVGRLKDYAAKLGVESKTWHFVTGNSDSIYNIAADYFSFAKEDAESPGGFVHSGQLILVDKHRRVRSFCDGTDEKDVSRFLKEIDVLLNEKE